MKRWMILFALLMPALYVSAQWGPRVPTPNDNLESVKTNADGSVTFSIYAPQADTVALGGDIMARDARFIKSEIGVWSATIAGVKPGAYRFNFIVDGVTVYDPKGNVNDRRPVAEIVPPGEAMFWQQTEVPHGAVSQISYKSSTTGATRRMHVWTPAGYNSSTVSLPVLYLIHGGGDNDSAWPTVGCANHILDNLLADGKMVPMIVVMPNGSMPVDKFTDELMRDIIPYIESNYRVKADKDNRAIAGLSMGGLETLEVFMAYPDQFAFINVMSSGWFKDNAQMYERGDKILKEIAPTLNRNVKRLIFTQGGPEDIAYKNGKEMLTVFDKNGIKYEFSEMPGGHTWHVWRHDLYRLAPVLFK